MVIYNSFSNNDTTFIFFQNVDKANGKCPLEIIAREKVSRLISGCYPFEINDGLEIGFGDSKVTLISRPRQCRVD